LKFVLPIIENYPMSSPPNTLPVHKQSSDSTVASGALWTGFLFCTLIAFALLFIPVFIIRPFRYQSPRALLLAMFLRSHAPVITLIAALGSVLFAIALWNAAGRWRKAALVFGLFIVTFSAVMVRLNHFEWMFHPIDRPEFLAQKTSQLDAKEMILAVRLGSDARAYPISQMAYHHVLNDVVGGVPIAVTY
jgi:phosphoglycerol transferase MdoB-like AlkP superfamily enzyme